MSKINQIIPKQGFEIVRDLIGSILKIELENQKSLQMLNDEINVFSARTTPFQQSEKLMINVLLDSADYSSTFERGAQGKTNFFVDIYTSAKETDLNDGGLASTIKCDKFLGMIRFILQDHHYMTLGLLPGLVMGTNVDGFENFEPNNSQDSSFVKMSRLSFSVRLNEYQTLWDSMEINTIFTDVKLDLTQRGYKYELIN